MLPKAKLTKLLIAELAAVPTGAQEAQGTAILKRKDAKPTEIRKQSAMTTATQGHQHLLYCVDESQSGSTSYESSYVDGSPNDCYTGHCHPWIRNADGTITIGESLGHTHDVGALSASLAQSSTVEKTTIAEKSGASAREKSTRTTVVSQPALTSTEKSTMDPKDQEIATLKKTLAAVIALSSAEHAHYKTLSGDEQAAFLAKSAADRGAIVADIAKRNEEADKVVYLAKSGEVYKAKDDPRLVEMAKRLDAEADKVKKAAIVDLRKSTFKNAAAGKDEVLDRFIEKHMGDEEEMTVLRAMVENSRIGKGASGFNGGADDVTEGDDAGDAMEKLEKGLVAFCAEKKIEKNVWTDGLSAFVKTEKGAALKRAYEESRAG